ncbi:hypothetical protein ACW95P_02825 [Candidatus Mycoplasma pogonae]
MKNTNNNFKLQNLRKTSLFVLSTIPLIASSIAISGVGNGPNDWYDGESIMDWINNPINNIKNLTPGQKEAFVKGNAHTFGKNDILQVESDMAELYQRYIAMKKLRDTTTGEYYPHYSQSEEFVRPIFDKALEDAKNALSNPNYNVIDFVEIKKLGEDLYKKWNALDGFENILLKEVASKKVLTPAIKAYFNNWIIVGLRSMRENEMGERNNINEAYLGKVKEWKSLIDQATKKLEGYIAFINEYKIKKNEAKYQNATSRLKEDFDNAIENALKADIMTPDIESEKQKIINAWNNLDGLVNSNENLRTLENKIQDVNKLPHLTNGYKQKIIDLLNSSGKRTANLSKTNEKYSEDLEKIVADAREKDNQFNSVVEAFKNYQNTIGTIKYDEASNKLAEDTKVFEALASILEDPAQSDGSIAKTVDNLLNKSYDLQYFKLKFTRNLRDVQSAIQKINQAKNALNGVEEFQRKKQVLIDKLNEEPLKNLNTPTKNDIKSKINAAKTSSELSDIEAKADDLNKAVEYLKSVIADMEGYKRNGEYTLATNRSEYDAALQSLKDKLVANLFVDSVDNLSRFISNGVQAKTKLNGLEVRKNQLKEKLKTLPLSNLNQETKEAITAKIDGAHSVSELDSLDTKATEIANTFKTLKDKITDLEAYKNNVDYTLSTENLKTAYDNALASLKTKDTTNILDDTVDLLTNLVQAGTTAKDNLNGIEQLQSQKEAKVEQAKNAIKSLNKLNNNLKNEFEQKISALLTASNSSEPLDQFSNKVTLIQTEATTLNNLFAEMNTALTKFRDRYHIETNGKLSTNWDTEKEKVLSAIDEVVTISLSRNINNTYDLQTNSSVMFKPGATATKVQEIISKIKTATAALNGDLIAKQNALKTELAKEPFNKLDSAIIQKITQEINAATTLESLNLFEAKINTAKPVVVEINDKVTQLINMEASKNYKLASDDKQSSFNTIKNNIESLLSQDLFEATKLEQAKETLKTFNNINLDGDKNLEAALEKLNNLTNIKVTQRTAIVTKAQNLDETDNKTKLDNLVTTFTAINNDIATKQSAIAGLSHLSPEVQKYFKDQLSNINPSLDKTQIDTKLAKDLANATTLNAKFTDLEAKLKSYTDVIGTSKHNLATNKDAEDNKVIAELAKVLATPTVSTLTATTNINGGTLSVTDDAKVDETITAIDNSLKTLDGENILKKQKTDYANEIKNQIKVLPHFSNDLGTEFDNRISALITANVDNATQSLDEFKPLINALKTEAENLNNDYDKLSSALQDYLNTFDKTKYIKATNKDEQNNAVFTALNEVLEPSVSKPSDLTKDYTIAALKMKFGTTTTKINEAVAKITAAKVALNGETILKQQKTDFVTEIKKEIAALNHISVDLAHEFDDKIDKIAAPYLDNADQDLDAFKVLVNAVKTTSEKLNSEYSKVNDAFVNYKNTIGTNAYDHATNQNTQNDAVFAALNTLVDPKLTKPTTLTKDYKVDSLKLAVGTDLAKLTKAVDNIKAATVALDGDQVVLKNKKDELKNLLKNSPLNDLPDSVKDKLKEEINSKSDLGDLNKIKDRIDTAKDVIEKVKAQIIDLTAKKATPDYKLADKANKNNLDEALTKLNGDLTKDLFDQTNVDEAKENIDAAKNVTLNGDAHLQAAKKQIDDLVNLSNNQKNQAKTKLDEIANSSNNKAGNPTSKADLDAAVENFKAIDNEMEIAKNKIANLSHLNNTVTNKGKDDISKIDIKDLSSSEAKVKSDEIVNKLTVAHNQLDQLQTKLKEYTDTIGTVKHDLTNDVKAIDQKIKNSLANILDSLPSGELVKNYNISGAKLKTANAEDIQTAITAIGDRLSKLNGEQVLAAKIKELIDKLTSDAALTTLNQTTKNAIITEANKAKTLEKLKEIEDKAKQAVLDQNKLQQVINDLKTAKESANYKLADPAKQADFDSNFTTLENALANNDLYDKTTVAIDAISAPAKNANTALDGNSNLEKALKDIEGMTNIPATPQRAAIKTRAKNLTEINNKAALDNLITKFSTADTAISNANTEIEKLNHLSQGLQNQFKAKVDNINVNADQTEITNTIKKHVDDAKALEAKFTELAEAVEKYKAAMATRKYLEADLTNQASQNQKVQEALESVLKDKTYTDFANEFNTINNETLKSNTTLANVEAAIAKIKDALNSLDGTKQVDDVKKDLKDKVNNLDGIYNKLNDATKGAVLDEIDNADTDTKAKVNHIDQKAKSAFDTHNKLTDKVKELEDFKNNPNYKLASDAEKTAYDNAITKLKEELNKNLLDSDNKTTSNTAMSDADAAKNALDGNTNLAKAKEEIDKLTNLPDEIQNDIKNNLDTIAASGDGSNSKLTDEVNKAKETAQKLADTIQAIDGQPNLSDAAKTALKDQAKAIDANTSISEIAKKLDEVTQKAKDLNDKFNDLKNAYNKYKDAMDSSKYKDATSENKAKQDEAVTAATNSVLDSPTTPSATTDLQGKVKAGTTTTDLDQAIKDIEKALNNLDGDTELQKAKTELIDKTNPGNNLDPLSVATKNAIKEEVNNAASKKDVKDISDKADEALNTLKTIEEEIKKLNDAKVSDDYKLASDDKKQQLDEALKELTDLKDSNLIDTSIKDKLDKAQVNSDKVINELDGKANLDNAQKTIDGFTNLSLADREKAKKGIPTTSLDDLNKYVDDIKAINDEIKKQNDFIDKLPNISDEAKAQAKDKIAEVVDLDKSKEENIENIQKVVDNILDINNHFSDLREVIDNYLSVRQTPTYTASTNGVEQDQKFVNALNKVIAKPITSPDDNIVNRFKAGVNEDKINEAIVKIKQATADLDGNIEVNKFKDKLIDMIDNDAKYKHLSQATKESLKAKIYAVNPNESNWKEQLNIILLEVENIITRVNQVLAKIVKLETLGATKYKTEITELKKILEQDWTRPIHLPEDGITDNQNFESQSTNKLWWLLSLLGLIPLSLAALWAKMKKKR